MARCLNHGLPLTAAPPQLGACPTIEVRVLMFGLICQATRERQVNLTVEADATVGDVIDALGARYGAAFTDQVMRTAGTKASYSMVAVDDRTVRDLSMPLAPGRATATVEIILLTGHEGG